MNCNKHLISCTANPFAPLRITSATQHLALNLLHPQDYAHFEFHSLLLLLCLLLDPLLLLQHAQPHHCHNQLLFITINSSGAV